MRTFKSHTLFLAAVVTCAIGASIASGQDSAFEKNFAAWRRPAGQRTPTGPRTTIGVRATKPVQEEAVEEAEPELIEAALAKTPAAKPSARLDQNVRRTAWEDDQPTSYHEMLPDGDDPLSMDGCLGCGGDRCCEDGCGGCCGPPLWWFRKELLLWWEKGMGTPALITSSPVGTPSTVAGVLPNSSVLLGNGGFGGQGQFGGRFEIGTWFNSCQNVGVAGRFFILEKASPDFNISSDQNPILARPFFDVGQQQNNALLAAFPNLRTGSINVQAKSEFFGADVFARLRFCNTGSGRVDLVSGYQFFRLNEGLAIQSNSLVTEVGGNIPNGTTNVIHDQFNTTNEFHGGLLGFLWERQSCLWTLQSGARVALGNMHETVRIRGTTVTTQPNQAPSTANTGLLAAASNSGTFVRDQFAAIPEFNLNLSRRVSQHCEVNIGYTLICFNHAARPGDQIVLSNRPTFSFVDSNFWVQGLSVGLTGRY